MSHPLKAKMTGITLALAAASLVGCANHSSSPSASTASGSPPATGSTSIAGTTDLVHCYGVNVCKGHNDCKTANNACAGQASCMGTGFVAAPSKACNDIGGKIKDNWRGSIVKVNLVRCYGVNVCKGHNDCKTANNACAGHASCKGQGFVDLPAKSCADVGGKKGA